MRNRRFARLGSVGQTWGLDNFLYGKTMFKRSTLCCRQFDWSSYGFNAQPHSVLYSSKFTFIPGCIASSSAFKHCIAFIPTLHSSRCIHVECTPRGNIKSNAALRGSEETWDVGETSSNQDPPSPDLVRSDHFNLCNSSKKCLQCISNQIKFRVKCSPMSRVLTLRSCHVSRAAPVQPYDPWIRATDYSENSPLPI